MPSFSNFNFLITAGPTWVPIDSVRVITSRFSGTTGLFIARYFEQIGANIDLLMGPGRANITPDDEQKIRIHHFTYYDELDKLLQEKISKEKYNVIIHSSAVSDYTPIDTVKGKISSQKDLLTINLTPTKKLIDKVREQAKDSFLIKFKLQVGLTEEKLIEVAYKSLQETNANLIVANNLEEVGQDKHTAYVIYPDKSYIKVSNKLSLCQELAKAITA